MRRGYTADQYRKLVDKIRKIIPQVAIHTDIIVGFPGETRAQFMETYRILEELKLDKAHLARYSPRPQTVSAAAHGRRCAGRGKTRRATSMLEDLQARVVAEINAQYLGRTVEVLVEDANTRAAGARARRRTSWCSLKPRAIGRAGWQRSKSPGPVPGACKRVCRRKQPAADPLLVLAG